MRGHVVIALHILVCQRINGIINVDEGANEGDQDEINVEESFRFWGLFQRAKVGQMFLHFRSGFLGLMLPLKKEEDSSTFILPKRLNGFKSKSREKENFSSTGQTVKTIERS